MALSGFISGLRGLYLGALLGALLIALGLFVYPYFPNDIPAAQANVIIQSMIEVDGVIFAFSAVVTAIIGLNPKANIKVPYIFAFFLGTMGLFLGGVFWGVVDLANMGPTISRFVLLRDVLTPVSQGLATVYLLAEIYKLSLSAAPPQPSRLSSSTPTGRSPGVPPDP